jgi:hypothetical protein
MKALFTVAAAVALSVICSVWATSSRKVDAQSDTVQAKRVEIVDSNNRVRVEIGIANQSGRDVPEMTFRDEKGNVASLLTLDDTGNGTLYFSGNGTEGKVSVGYLWGSDSKSPGQEDPLGAWGIRVRGRDGFQNSMGISNSGKVIAPKPSSETLPHGR